MKIKNILKKYVSRKFLAAVAGVALGSALALGVDASDVTFDSLTEAEIAAYVASGDPLDKAGSYGVQGQASLFISHLDGCFFGVMGLPLYLVRRLLQKAGYPLFA